MTTTTITRRTRKLGWGFSLFGEDVTAPDFEGTPRQVLEYAGDIRNKHTTQNLHSFRSAWFLNGKRVEFDEAEGVGELVDPEYPIDEITATFR